jgi:hypothetical protein
MRFLACYWLCLGSMLFLVVHNFEAFSSRWGWLCVERMFGQQIFYSMIDFMLI